MKDASMNTLKEISRQYLRAGLSVLPANVQLKFAALSGWKQYQQRLPTRGRTAGVVQ